ncbi:CPBP family intramembrane glutamic endopeptidase [Jiulongibacter sp. NS-SX5]|uniref:CPBP family intramembrane glutamic endopeptidase n=1 Tax=Jiulongibacter sp. NS-SX5 TaxID=3463854 RepID=UPI00405851D0
MPQNHLRPFWSKLFQYDWRFGSFLIVLICIPRFFLVLNANETANYGPIGAIMFISALAPFIFLSKQGRTEIGLKVSNKPIAVFLALLAGLGFSLVLFKIGDILYSGTYQNWYQYIGKSYNIPNGISGNEKMVLFAVMAATGMIFSPIGEELFFRGIVHESFAQSFGSKTASLIDASAFAITHIAHFGLVFLDGSWKFFAIPTIIWVLAMFLVSLLFFYAKQKSNSLLGAIAAHAGFNLGMIYSIFYLL